ncbi:hypothetical protein [Weissella minor]|uniref:hypothetical protein n=1 Tax=Weissella minor TaxID=1620 RepID=UPI003AF25666
MFLDNLNIRNLKKIDDQELLVEFNYNNQFINMTGRVTLETENFDITFNDAKQLVLEQLEEEIN